MMNLSVNIGRRYTGSLYEELAWQNEHVQLAEGSVSYTAVAISCVTGKKFVLVTATAETNETRTEVAQRALLDGLKVLEKLGVDENTLEVDRANLRVMFEHPISGNQCYMTLG